MVSQDPSPSHPQDLRTTFTSAILPLLTDTPVLHILSKLQRTLDVLDIEGLSTLWHRTEISSPLYRTTFASSPTPPLSPPTSPIGVSSPYLSSPEPSIADWTAFLDAYLSPHSELNHSEPDPANLRYYLLAYLLSATFKDCSIILRLDPLVPRAGDTGSGDAGTDKNDTAAPMRRNRVTVIDLDPKTMTRLQKWEKLDRQIVEAYSGSGAGPRGCVDAWVD
jgi:inositol-pentakisphosphate 2-kinase